MQILLIEDNLKLCQTLQHQLTRQGFVVEICHNGEEGLEFILQQSHDLILLDRMLPGLDGIEVLRIVRQKKINTPIILITALGELDDKISGLDTGADDYLVKPFAFEELMARIRSISRRPRQLQEVSQCTFGDLTLDVARKQLYGNGSSCQLTQKEAQLLELFLANPNQVLPRSLILSKIWGYNTSVEDGNIDNYIYLVRRKLRAVESCLTVTTIHRIGYRLEDQNV